MLGVTGEGGETDRDTARVLATLVYERVHRLLHYILELSPTCATLFCELMVRHMPYRTRPVAQQVAYVTNLLHVAGTPLGRPCSISAASLGNLFVQPTDCNTYQLKPTNSLA